jgi:hypothetical protein
MQIKKLGERPEQEMRAAATLLREVASGTSHIPWRASGNSLDGPGTYVAIVYQCFADATWMALTDPGLAGPLAGILEQAADTWQQEVREDGVHEGCYGTVDDDCCCFEHPTVLARRILAKAQHAGRA